MFRELPIVDDFPCGSLEVKTQRLDEVKHGAILSTVLDVQTKTPDTPPFDQFTARELIENGINMQPASTKFLEPSIGDLFTDVEPVKPNENE